jgi:hypothetical protein
MADRRYDRRNDHRRSNYSQRNHQNHNHGRFSRDHRHYNRTPVRVHNGHYHFNNGHRARYYRPSINVRYTNYRVRPVVLVERYDRVPGYVWVQGHWNWNGVEWIWISGHYAVDVNYVY